MDLRSQVHTSVYNPFKRSAQKAFPAMQSWHSGRYIVLSCLCREMSERHRRSSGAWLVRCTACSA